MENKEVEKVTNRLYKPYSSSVELQMLYKEFNGEGYSVDGDIHLIDEEYKKLEKENAELKQQLQAKDKALDKAYYELSERHCYEFDNLQTKEDWKEYLEEFK